MYGYVSFSADVNCVVSHLFALLCAFYIICIISFRCPYVSVYVMSVLFYMRVLLMIIYEPRGIYGIWIRLRTWLELFPLYRKGMFRRTRTYLKTERMR